MNIADLRRNYTHAGLTEADAGDDPLTLFRRWFDAAAEAKLPEPNAMALATVSAEGRPSNRIVLLKGVDHGLTFFTNYLSRKSRELQTNPFAAVVFLWDEIERQVRVEGTVEQVTAAESDAYYHSRPLSSRLGAWASEQSEVIPGRQILEQHQAELMAKYPDGNVPRPPHWGGYRLLPDAFEFWQGRPSRLHDRIRFRKEAGGWKRERLSP
ncbi:pyridoxamine 5'-phosphate oxidase [Limnoglobus roseus]|nr:pyridoxamine 5'-phosphate oxidase [Limnoglobus roseus]